jgi:hypothetical protein
MQLVSSWFLYLLPAFTNRKRLARRVFRLTSVFPSVPVASSSHLRLRRLPSRNLVTISWISLNET